MSATPAESATLLVDTATSREPETRGSALALRGYAAMLGPSESAVARAILAHASRVPEWSTHQLADAAGTSTATVIRACQRIGFRGFQHLRLEIAREGTPEHTVPSPGDAVTRAFDSASAALAIGRDAVDRGALTAAAEALARAGRVVCTANGFSAPPLQDAAMRLATIGRPVEAPLDILAQQFAARTLGTGDACLALSHSGANAHTLTTARAAHRRGARIIVLCSYARAPLPDIADIAIATGAAGPHHAVDPFFIRIGHSVLLQALVSEVSALMDPPDPAGMREVVADALADSAR